MSGYDQLRAQQRELTLELARLERLRQAKVDDDDPASGEIAARLAIEITRLTGNLDACQRELAACDRPQQSA